MKRSFNSDRVGRVYPCIAQYWYCIVASIVRTERRLEVLDTTNLVQYEYSCIFLTPKSVSRLSTEKVYCTLRVGLRASWREQTVVIAYRY